MASMKAGWTRATSVDFLLRNPPPRIHHSLTQSFVAFSTLDGDVTPSTPKCSVKMQVHLQVAGTNMQTDTSDIAKARGDDYMVKTNKEERTKKSRYLYEAVTVA
ncbi:hypothetical protein TNCV_396711 [Trichonephila clavipes]|nr:hypothetical protein TNCV_396711 [Trichonephila clavipes]